MSTDERETAHNETAVARPLKVLVPLIKEELDAAGEAANERYRRAGEMLLEAKAQLPHGEWGGWVDRNFHLSQRQARRYMQLAWENGQLAWENGRRRPFSTLTEALGERSRDERRWPPVNPIAASVNEQRLAAERESQRKEEELVRELALKIVSVGYRALAEKLHPDKPGGSEEEMRRLNAAKKMLKENIGDSVLVGLPAGLQFRVRAAQSRMRTHRRRPVTKRARP